MNVSPTSRITAVLIGAGLVGLGVWMAFPFWDPHPNPHGPGPWANLALVAPTLFFCGLVAMLGGALVGTAIFRWRTLLLVGLLMLLVGAFPWIYTPLLVGDHGGEGSGMLGTLLFLFVGVPGLILTIAGALLGR